MKNYSQNPSRKEIYYHRKLSQRNIYWERTDRGINFPFKLRTNSLKLGTWDKKRVKIQKKEKEKIEKSISNRWKIPCRSRSVWLQITTEITVHRRWGRQASFRSTPWVRAFPIGRSSFFIFWWVCCHCYFQQSEGDSHVAGTGLPVLVFIGRWPDRRRLPVSGTPSSAGRRTSATRTRRAWNYFHTKRRRIQRATKKKEERKREDIIYI